MSRLRVAIFSETPIARNYDKNQGRRQMRNTTVARPAMAIHISKPLAMVGVGDGIGEDVGKADTMVAGVAGGRVVGKGVGVTEVVMALVSGSILSNSSEL